MNEIPIEKSAVEEVISLEKADKNSKKYNKKKYATSIPEKIARTEDTIEKIVNRINRRKKILDDIENKYQKQGIKLPENIQFQYDNTKTKMDELEEIYTKKTHELEGLKQALSNEVVEGFNM